MCVPKLAWERSCVALAHKARGSTILVDLQSMEQLGNKENPAIKPARSDSPQQEKSKAGAAQNAS